MKSSFQLIEGYTAKVTGRSREGKMFVTEKEGKEGRYDPQFTTRACGPAG